MYSRGSDLSLFVFRCLRSLYFVGATFNAKSTALWQSRQLSPWFMFVSRTAKKNFQVEQLKRKLGLQRQKKVALIRWREKNSNNRRTAQNRRKVSPLRMLKRNGENVIHSNEW